MGIKRSGMKENKRMVLWVLVVCCLQSRRNELRYWFHVYRPGCGCASKLDGRYYLWELIPCLRTSFPHTLPITLAQCLASNVFYSCSYASLLLTWTPDLCWYRCPHLRLLFTELTDQTHAPIARLRKFSIYHVRQRQIWCIGHESCVIRRVGVSTCECNLPSCDITHTVASSMTSTMPSPGAQCKGRIVLGSNYYLYYSLGYSSELSEL